MSVPTPPVRVLVVARQPRARAGLRALLGEHRDLLVVGQSGAVAEAERIAAGLAPDVVLMEWEPGAAEPVTALATGVGAAGVPLVLIGDLPPSQELPALVRAGVRGFLLADATADELAAALRAARQGLLVFDPIVARSLSASAVGVTLGELATGEQLTEREREVLQLIALGLPNKAIAGRLHISEHTVKFHVGAILAKLGSTSRTEAVTRAVRRGLLVL